MHLHTHTHTHTHTPTHTVRRQQSHRVGVGDQGLGFGRAIDDLPPQTQRAPWPAEGSLSSSQVAQRAARTAPLSSPFWLPLEWLPLGPAFSISCSITARLAAGSVAAVGSTAVASGLSACRSAVRSAMERVSSMAAGSNAIRRSIGCSAPYCRSKRVIVGAAASARRLTTWLRCSWTPPAALKIRPPRPLDASGSKSTRTGVLQVGQRATPLSLNAAASARSQHGWQYSTWHWHGSESCSSAVTVSKQIAHSESSITRRHELGFLWVSRSPSPDPLALGRSRFETHGRR